MHRFGRASFEKVHKKPGRSFAFREFDLPRFDSPWHFHPEIELTLVLAGTGRRFVGDHIEDFEPGDLVLVGSELPHYWHSEPDRQGQTDRAHSLVFQFLPNFLGNKFMELPELDGISRLFRQASRGLRFIGQTRDRVAEIICSMELRAGPDQLLGLLEILNVLSNSTEVQILASNGFAPCFDDRAEERINRSQAYILEHLEEPIRLEDVAAHVNMSPSAFSRYFKKIMGKTFSHFVNELRIGQACRALLETERSIAEIAFESGYNNLSNFNRRFQELRGINPRRFRKRFAVSNRVDMD
jgi:AraC-like DNA-binding protein